VEQRSDGGCNKISNKYGVLKSTLHDHISGDKSGPKQSLSLAEKRGSFQIF